MTDYSGLIARVRSPYALTERDAQEIADALEAQAKEIAELKDQLRLISNDCWIATARIAKLEAASKAFSDLAKPAQR